MNTTQMRQLIKSIRTDLFFYRTLKDRQILNTSSYYYTRAMDRLYFLKDKIKKQYIDSTIELKGVTYDL